MGSMQQLELLTAAEAAGSPAELQVPRAICPPNPLSNFKRERGVIQGL